MSVGTSGCTYMFAFEQGTLHSRIGGLGAHPVGRRQGGGVLVFDGDGVVGKRSICNEWGYHDILIQAALQNKPVPRRHAPSVLCCTPGLRCLKHPRCEHSCQCLCKCSTPRVPFRRKRARTRRKSQTSCQRKNCKRLRNGRDHQVWRQNAKALWYGRRKSGASRRDHPTDGWAPLGAEPCRKNVIRPIVLQRSDSSVHWGFTRPPP